MANAQSDKEKKNEWEQERWRDAVVQKTIQIKRFSAESTDWQIPLQSTYAVRHFAKATNTVRDGCIQATGRLASAACI